MVWKGSSGLYVPEIQGQMYLFVTIQEKVQSVDVSTGFYKTPTQREKNTGVH